MKGIFGLVLILILPAATFAVDPDLVISATHGDDIIFGVLEEQGAKVNLLAFRTDPAAGVVGFTTVRFSCKRCTA